MKPSSGGKVEQAGDSESLELLARVGLIAYGVVHLLISGSSGMNVGHRTGLSWFLLLRQRFWAGAAGLWFVPVLRRFLNGSRQFR